MPYNGSGTYNLPLALVVGGTTITVTWGNTTTQDIATALSNALCRDGQSSMSGPLNLAGQNLQNLAAGAAATPSLYFTGDSNTGLYSGGADILGISTGGVARQMVLADGTVLFGRTTDNTLAMVQVESSAESTLATFQNTAAASFGSIRVMSNDRTLWITQTSTTHASTGAAILSTDNTQDLLFQNNAVTVLSLKYAAGTPTVTVANQLLFGAGTVTSMALHGTANQLIAYGGSSGFLVKSSGGVNTNLTVTDAGAVTARTSLASPIIDATSHRKYKREIEDVSALEIINNIRLHRYELAAVPGKKLIGFIHDELPESLRSGEEAVSLYGIAATALAGVAELTQLLKEKGLVQLAR